jgi:thymidylate synthase
MWHVIEADNANELWARVMSTLRVNEDVLMQPSRAGNTREILHAALTLRDPRQRWLTARRPAINPAFAIVDIFWILGGRRDAKFITYFNRALTNFVGHADELHGGYGYRLRHHFDCDQLTAAYDALRENPISRQVVLQIWDARVDLPDTHGKPRDPDIPCNTQSLLKVRNGKLEWLQVMRSNDAYMGLPYNLVQFTILQEVMAGWLGLELGGYHHVCDSLHLYERHLDSELGELSTDAPETFSLPRSASLRVISEMIEGIEQVIDERRSVTDLEMLVQNCQFPESYRNAMCLVVAEGIRRRHSMPAADRLMLERCTSPVFLRLWRNWASRIERRS